MDGLECSEIRMSDVCDTTTLRFDSDYYKKEYLEIEQFICKNRDKFVTIESQGLQVDASAFYPSLEPYYNTGTIPFVRVADVKDQIEYNACVNIPEMGEEFRTLHMCYPGDVVLTKGGRVGTAGLITQPSYVTRDLIFINASALSRKDYIVLYLFFSSSFAYKQMVRSSSMTAQPHLTITLIRDLLVCNYSNSFRDKVEKYFTTLEKLNHQAQILYSEAKQILIKELKVCTEGITSDSYTTKYLSTSFKVSGRLDAEYYQPKYDGYLSALEQFETTKISLEGGFSGKFVCTVKCASAETLTATIMCTNKSYRTKVDKDYAPIGVSVDYSAILMAIVQEIEDWQFVLTEASLIERFYEKLFNAISDAFFSEINNAKSSIPEKGNKRFLKVFDAMLAFCARALNAIKASCLNSEFGAEHKLLSQMPITNFLQSIEGGKEMTLADKEKAYLWFISFVYRLRNALFHEIIDPLNDEWQVIFKNSYHVLKQVVDQNIWRLKQLKLLPSASQAAAEEDYNREPPPDIDWPTDEEAKFTWFYYEMLKLNKDGARVLLKGKIDFAEHHYETECTVRWNESLSETAIKNASITSVVDSQEKELAAAI